MRLPKASAIPLCALLAAQLGCSSSDESKPVDGSTDLIELADKPLADRPLDLPSPDLIELADKPPADRPLDLPSPDLIELADKAPTGETGWDMQPGKDLSGPPIDGGLDVSSAVDQTPGPTLDGSTQVEGGEAGHANPCASCAANQVCVQGNDGTCHSTVFCKTVSDACRNKLASSGAKSCKSLPECESALCQQPYRCVYEIPCGNEVPEAAVYCYGP